MAAKKKPTAPKLNPVATIATTGRGHVATQQSRLLIEWSPLLIRSAQIQANAGNFWLLAELYETLLATDDRHSGTLADVVQKVSDFPRIFDADGIPAHKDAIEKAIEADFPHMAPLSELVALISQGLSLGFAIGQLLPWRRTRRGNRIAPRLTAIPPGACKYDDQRRKWLVCTQEGDFEITPGDGQWILFLPYGSDRPWLKGTWRQCARWALLKLYAIRDWARQGENAAGIRTAETDPEAEVSDPLRRQLAEDLAKMGAEGVIVPPAGVKLALLQMSAQTWQTFEGQTQAANDAIAVANKGESFTSGSGSSGLGDGAGQTRSEVSQARAAFVARALEELFFDQLLTPWSLANFGELSPIPDLTYQTEDEEEQGEIATTWKTAGEALVLWAPLLAVEGEKIDYAKAARDLGLPLLERPAMPTPPSKPDLAPTMPETQPAAQTSPATLPSPAAE